MRSRLTGLAVAALAATLVAGPAAMPAFAAGPQPWSQAFDPKRDPAVDLKEAMAVAKSQGKRILVDVGGDWCVWCRLLDNLFATNTGLAGLKDANYVTLKVHWDKKENQNTAFLSQYPKIGGYPHIFILAADGTLLHSQDTAELELPKEQGKGHDPAKVEAFLRKWAPPPKAA